MCQTFALPIIVHVIFVQWGQLTCATRSYLIAISHHFRLIYFSTCATYIAHARFCFLATFRELSLKLYCVYYYTFYIKPWKNCSRFLLLVPPTGVIHIFLCFTANRVIWHYQQWLLFATTIVYWLILHWSVYCLDHQTVTLTLTTISTTI